MLANGVQPPKSLSLAVDIVDVLHATGRAPSFELFADGYQRAPQTTVLDGVRI